MSTQTPNYLDIIERLPAGAKLELPDIDMTNDSLDEFPIRAALGVPEIWRYDGKSTHFYKLEGEKYEEIQTSLAFPVLTAQDLMQCLGRSKAAGQTATLRAFRLMLRARAPS